jgi:hypothetical protein
LWNTLGTAAVRRAVNTSRNIITLVLAAAWMACSVPARAADRPAGDQTAATPAEAGVPEIPEAGDEDDKCKQQPARDELPEKVQSGVFRFACHTVRWVDSLFGDSRDFREESIEGRMTFGFAWNQYEHWDPSLRFRVRTELPNLSSRWNAFLGRVDEEDYVSGAETFQESSLRRGISDRDESDWLLGLGYRDRDEQSGGWDYSVGVRLRVPPRVYVRARYEKNAAISPRLDLRYRQTIFWRDGTGFGTTTHLDSARELSLQNVLRWEFIGRITEETEGVEWWIGNIWYHRLGDNRGVSLRSFARGATDHEVELLEYGFELTWRRQVIRDWLYINAGPTLTWPRERREERREASLGFQVLMEMRFGYLGG